jgi:hypothetical protein
MTLALRTDTERLQKEKKKKVRVYGLLAHTLTSVVLMPAPAAPLMVAKTTA